MTAHAIISKPKRKILVAFVLLHHKVVRLPAKLVGKMLGPDQIALLIKKHGTWIPNAPTSWCQKVQQSIIAPLVPLHEVGHWRIEVDLSDEGVCWVVSVAAIIDGFIHGRRTSGLGVRSLLVCGSVEAERQMPEEEKHDVHEGGGRVMSGMMEPPEERSSGWSFPQMPRGLKMADNMCCWFGVSKQHSREGRVSGTMQ